MNTPKVELVDDLRRKVASLWLALEATLCDECRRRGTVVAGHKSCRIAKEAL